MLVSTRFGLAVFLEDTVIQLRKEGTGGNCFCDFFIKKKKKEKNVANFCLVVIWDLLR